MSQEFVEGAAVGAQLREWLVEVAVEREWLSAVVVGRGCWRGVVWRGEEWSGGVERRCEWLWLVLVGTWWFHGGVKEAGH